MKNAPSKQINIRITLEIHKSLRIRAAELGISFTELINQILKKEIGK